MFYKSVYIETNELPPYWGVGAAATSAGLLLYRWTTFGRRWLKSKKKGEILGVRPESAGAAGMKTPRRWRFALLGATEVAETLAPAPLFGAWGLGALTESAVAEYWIPTTVASVALLLFAGVVAASVARDAKRRPDCERSGCLWVWREAFEASARLCLEEKHCAKALAQIPAVEALLAAESARTVEILRSASELTPEGAMALRNAEAEVAAAEKNGDAE